MSRVGGREAGRVEGSLGAEVEVEEEEEEEEEGHLFGCIVHTRQGRPLWCVPVCGGYACTWMWVWCGGVHMLIDRISPLSLFSLARQAWLEKPSPPLQVKPLCQSVAKVMEEPDCATSFLGCGHYGAASCMDDDFIVTIISSPECPAPEVLLKAKELAHSVKLLFDKQIKLLASYSAEVLTKTLSGGWWALCTMHAHVHMHTLLMYTRSARIHAHSRLGPLVSYLGCPPGLQAPPCSPSST